VYAGETFFFREKQAHLWIVASDPAIDSSRVVLFNMTTYRPGLPHKEAVCLLQPGDHSFVTHATCINYHDARVLPDSHLTSLLARDRIVLSDKLDDPILQKVRQGASLSRLIKYEVLEILLDQGVLD
jgi:hypothetical protein